MRPVSRRILPVAILLVPACAQLPPCQPVSTRPQLSPRHVAMAADGAGDYRTCSETIRATAQADARPLEVITFVWSHGYLHNLADHTDYAFARDRGRELAELVVTRRQAHPDVPVSLIGHSAGCGVVLAAAEQLPPDSIERVILLGPSVSSHYDIRPALRAARYGVDLFCSPRDVVWLGAFIQLFGAMDDPIATRTAGRFGFDVRSDDPSDAVLCAKLRQYTWNPSLRTVGHDGGHFGAYAPEHLRRFILPLLE